MHFLYFPVLHNYPIYSAVSTWPVLLFRPFGVRGSQIWCPTITAPCARHHKRNRRSLRPPSAGWRPFSFAIPAQVCQPQSAIALDLAHGENEIFVVGANLMDEKWAATKLTTVSLGTAVMTTIKGLTTDHPEIGQITRLRARHKIAPVAACSLAPTPQVGRDNSRNSRRGSGASAVCQIDRGREPNVLR